MNWRWTLPNSVNEDELASIIGHEIYHNELGHIKKNIQSNILNEEIFGEDLGNFSYTMQQIFTSPFNQMDEVKCDLYGMDLINRSGYNICSTVEIWKRMKNEDEEFDPFNNLFRTHPYSIKREKCAENHVISNYSFLCK